MNYRQLKFRITGETPLVMHCGRLANPLDKFSKAMKRVSGKKAKTDADFEELARLEFLGGLYLHNGEPCLPGECMEAALIEAARKQKKGQSAKSAIISDGNYPLQYDGPRTPDELWSDERFRLVAGVKIQRNRVMRTRPIFREWAAEIVIDYMPDVLNKSEIEEMIQVAGRIIGVGDWRPKFGRFSAQPI